MNGLNTPEIIFIIAAIFLAFVGKELPEFLQSLVLSKKQFQHRRGQVHRPMELIDYNDLGDFE